MYFLLPQVGENSIFFVNLCNPTVSACTYSLEYTPSPVSFFFFNTLGPGTCSYSSQDFIKLIAAVNFC